MLIGWVRCGERIDAYRAAVGFYEANLFVRMKEKGTVDVQASTVPLFFDLLRVDPVAVENK